MYASRTQWKLTPNRLSERLQARRRTGLPILDLTESNPTQCAFQYPADDILTALTVPENLIYEPSPKGLREAREAVVAYYAEKGVMIDPEQILLTASTSEAYSFLFRLLANPGDRMLVPRPSYPLFDFLATFNDIELDPYPLTHNAGWRVDFAALRELIAPRTKALLVVNPNNPTGSFLQRAELAEMIELCRAHDLAFISDEVFADYPFGPNPDCVISLAGTSDMLTFALGGISKLLGLPQMKLAWICASGPADLLNDALARLEVIADTYLSVNTPVQRALPQWLALRDNLTQHILSRVRKNRQYLIDRTQPPHACECLAAEGGWYAVVRVPRTQSEEELVLDLLDQDGVLVHPGYFFDFDAEGYLVVSLLPPPEVFQEGIERVLMRSGERG
ncbi:MAG: pyridoxal phosphate-dependent aminotransferase [Acidobacteria bacterium]|nr:pyridoxal phosphate-dependent aminotransferase [Acidobacteriota bacterium]